MWEKDYGYEYPFKAIRYNDENWIINVRKMREDEMPEDGITYYCDIDGTIYSEEEKDFKIIN